MKLFLDDIRNPKGEGWIVVRDVKETIMLVVSEGFPEFVSFDHDLGVEIDGVTLKPTGYDFAKFLVEYDTDTGSMPDNFDYAVHSANPVGRENIEGLLTNYIKHKKQKQ